MRTITTANVTKRTFSMNVDSWNNFFNWSSVVLVALTVLAGAGALLTGKIISMRQEGAIAAAKAEAAKANERAAAADLNTEKARKESAEASREAAVANEAAGNANERAAALEVSAEELRRESLEIERSVSPRLFPIESDAVRAFEKFAPIEVVIKFAPDQECAAMASQLAEFLRTAKWTVEQPEVYMPGFVENLFVHVNTWESSGEDAAKGRAAAEALIAELKSKHIKAMARAAPPDDPPNVVVVEVGPRPNPVARRYFREWIEKTWPKGRPRPPGLDEF
jgi:hypothetical protein